LLIFVPNSNIFFNLTPLILWSSASSKTMRKAQIYRCWDAADKKRAGQLTISEFRDSMDVLWENDFFEDEVP